MKNRQFETENLNFDVNENGENVNLEAKYVDNLVISPYFVTKAVSEAVLVNRWIFESLTKTIFAPWRKI